MNLKMNTLAATLIKVKLGSEENVGEWLRRKTFSPITSRYCRKTEPAAQDCALCPDKELRKKAEERTGIFATQKLPCEDMKVLGIGYVTGPFDFLFVAEASDSAVIEQFVVKCLRSGEISKHITDTQTLSGLVSYPTSDQT